MSIKIKVLPVYQGDALFLFINENKFSIVIDTGPQRSYSKGLLKDELAKIDNIELLILTHTDEDHIGGIIKYYEDENRKKELISNIWFNSGKVINEKLNLKDQNSFEVPLQKENDLKVSFRQGITLESEIIKDNIQLDNLIKSGDIYNFEYGKFTILSPETNDLKSFYNFWEIEENKPRKVSHSCDYSNTIDNLLINNKYTENGTIPNKASIAFLYTHDNYNILFMGDAYPSIIEKNIRILGFNEKDKLKLDIVKVSHHAGNYGISPELLKIIDCKHFIISTDGSNGLPLKECLARIVTHRTDKVTLYFNYKNETIENIFIKDEDKKHNFEVKYLSEENDYLISVDELV